jgi:predicted phage replisome organizer
MTENKKYYWLKLKDNFFKDKEIKKLRKIAGGDTYTIIYLKLQLLSLKNEGKLIFDGLEDSFSEEIALELDEDSENVKITLTYLQKCGLIEEINQNEFILPQTIECIGGETKGAARVRRFRNKTQALQCNTDVTNCNALVTKCNTEIEIRDRDKREDIEIENRDIKIIVDKPPKTQKFIPPTLEDVKEYCQERNNFIDAERFVDYYIGNGWMAGRHKMKDWKATVRNWEKRQNDKPKSTGASFYDL